MDFREHIFRQRADQKKRIVSQCAAGQDDLELLSLNPDAMFTAFVMTVNRGNLFSALATAVVVVPESSIMQ